MPSTETMLAFVSASLLLAVVPGPDNLFVLAHSAVHGAKAGFLIIAGLCTGLIFHTALVAFGMAALFRTSPLAFSALKAVGAAYLLVLAWQMFRADRLPSGENNAGPSPASIYLRGIVMNVTNPKVSIFFLAFLPQFANPSRGPIGAQIVIFGGLFCLATVLVFGAIALLASAVRRRLHSSGGSLLIINRAAALVFVGIALHLVLARM